jgi:hypothetical protein
MSDKRIDIEDLLAEKVLSTTKKWNGKARSVLTYAEVPIT